MFVFNKITYIIRHLLFIVLLILQTSICFAQKTTIPKNYIEIHEVKGDLDKDGIPEIVKIYNNTSKGNSENGFKRVLRIYKKENNQLKLIKENSTILKDSKDCGYCSFLSDKPEPILKIEIKKNTLRITQQTFNNSRRTEESRLIFRYQNNNWFLIGSTYKHYDTCDFDFTYDINFSINKMIISKEYPGCEDDIEETPSTVKSYKYTFPKTTMDSYKPTEIEILKGIYAYY